MASWGEDLNRYVAQKRQAPVAEPTERFTRKNLSSHEKAAARRDFNILNNTISNVEGQRQYDTMLVKDSETHIKRGIAKEMSAANHGYNILSMQPRFGMSEDAISNMGGNQEPRGKKIYERFTDYDVVTMEPKYQHVIDSEVAAAEAAVRRTSRRPRRATNVINHRYLANHDERSAAEEDERRRRLDVIADASSKLNPISGKFRRLDVEEKDIEARAAADATQRDVVANHTYRVSRLVGRSEGHAYDIVCNHLYNPEYVLNVERKGAQGLPQRARMRQTWEHQRDVEEALRENDGQRAMNRTSSERIKETLRRGHELLSNKPFGLSQDEVTAAGIQEDVAVKEATFRPIKSLSVLNTKTVLERLDDTSKPKAWSETQVLREAGPRTTMERVFHSAPNRSLLEVSTFEGRSSLLLPTLEKKLNEKKSSSMRQFY